MRNTPSSDPRSSGRESSFRRIQEFLGWVSASEALPAPPSPGSSPRAPGLVAWLLSPEPPPQVDEPGSKAAGDPGFWSWLFAPELCPRNAGTGPEPVARRGFWAWLFAPEPGPWNVEPASQSPGHPGFLTWLFRPESLPTAFTASPERRENIDGSS